MAQSMAYNQAAGLGGMLKSGHQSMEGVQGATLRNVEACRGISTITRTSLGPNGMNKLVVNHLGKIIVTSDCATIVKALEIEHPAAKMLQLAAEAQDFECGDGTNLVVSFAGELLAQTEDLFRMGLHPSDAVAGFSKAADKLLEDFLPPMAELVPAMADGRSMDELVRVIKPVVAAKQLGSEDILAPLVAEACLGSMSSSSGPASFSVDSVRVAKILGGDISQSHVVHGFVALRGLETSVTSAKDAKIVVFGCGIEASSTEAKGTVLMKNADDLKNYNKSEEKKMEEIIKGIADAGIKVCVAGGTVSEMALHFIERYGMLCLKIGSKWELRRLCAATGATALVRLGAPTPDEMGHCDHIHQKEVGGRPVTIFSQSEGSLTSKLSTIVLRASTSSVLADLERAVDDGVHAAKTACKNGKLVPGAGATEMELSLKVRAFADTCPGLDQYAIRAFGKALEVVPRTLAENAGMDQGEVIAALGAAHASGKVSAGVDIGAMGIAGASGVCDETGVLDLYTTKVSALKLAIDSALTVLRVDQIIMSKQAGGGAAGAGMM
mmetsp:Transcript_767/g.1569  ORF Transcript_767/g.1569 Transcript_767/m.1569 type:complete len:553 (+) Transcript_767:108-1766(+)|eukprot:CAMPEP_0172326534 /NCGR_PEP_ID=MMETSP1058-20130122/56822_1 /TAXON_ID=83371 /ORGANISM="Detonula confervacea, Strain CCMP 353" /LENGTH=552 /DNA_ID=CAMNT_0013043345 /DNA_START=25 /DNA_END=1683 /DNA_ORIENTATION=+